MTRKRKKPKKLLGGIESATSKPVGLPRRRKPNPYATCVTQFGHDGKIHFYLNAAIPDNHHPSEGICPKCGHAYSHMIGSCKPHCNECEGDRLAEIARRLEQAGIPLGWGFNEHTREYSMERMNARPTSRLQQNAKEV